MQDQPPPSTARIVGATRRRLAFATLGVVTVTLAVGGFTVMNSQESSRVGSTVPANPLSGALCKRYSIDTLTERAFAFDGTAKSVGRNARGDKVTTFQVHQWFVGGEGKTATVPLIPTSAPESIEIPQRNDFGGLEAFPLFRLGARLLVSGEFRENRPEDLSVAHVWPCGWARYYDSATADQWARAFGVEPADSAA